MAETIKSRGKKYRQLNRTYLKDAEKMFDNEDFSQASEKLWGAAAEMVKTVAAKRGVELGTHSSLWDYVSKLDKEHPELMLKRDFSYAGNLRQNFYEDWLGKEDIKEGLEVIKGFIEKLQALE
jgi:hypothetical protein